MMVTDADKVIALADAAMKEGANRQDLFHGTSPAVIRNALLILAMRAREAQAEIVYRDRTAPILQTAEEERQERDELVEKMAAAYVRAGDTAWPDIVKRAEGLADVLLKAKARRRED